MKVVLRFRAAMLAFRHPLLVAQGLHALEFDDLRKEAAELRVQGEQNLKLFESVMQSTCEATMDAVINAVRREQPRDDGDWWDGYDAALSDVRRDLRALKSELTVQAYKVVEMARAKT